MEPITKSRRLGSVRVKVNGPEIRRRRLATNETLRELGERAQVGSAYLCTIENTPVRTVSLGLFERLCEALGAAPEDLKADLGEVA